jgi:DNA-binding NtrC family response regulator
MPHTVLVIDDEPGVVKYVGTLLQRAGYAVIPAIGPHEALQAFTDSPDSISLVLTDIVMPEVNGLELIKLM